MRALVLAIVLVSAPARAEPGDKSEGAAIAWTIAGTVGGIGVAFGTIVATRSIEPSLLVVDGVVMTALPSAGYWYAGEPLSWGMLPRAIGAALVGYTITRCSGSDTTYCTEAALGWTGVALFVFGSVLDAATAPRAVRTHNQRRHAAIVPQVLRPPSGPVMGIGVSGRF